MQKPTFAILTIVVLACCVSAQTPLSTAELSLLLDKAERSTRQYSAVFRNLSAEETKTFEDFDKNGNIKETRRIKSLFIVYQSSRNPKTAVSEFRNVLEFNGKTAVRKDKEIGEFFEKLAKAATDREESRKLREESNRFDGKSSSWGITLGQIAPLGNLRRFFSFQIEGAEKIESREVLVIEYRQIEPTLLIKADATAEELKQEPNGIWFDTSTPEAFRPTNPRLAGKLWLDAETGQIWRNEFQVVLHPARLSQPIVSEELLFEYQPSEFKILVPKRFVLTTYKISGSNDKNFSIVKDRRMTFEYSKFSEAKTEVQKYEVSK